MKPEDQQKTRQAIQSMPDSERKRALLKALEAKGNPNVDVKK